jgi:hypothetical protein
MPTLKRNCPICDKILILVDSSPLDGNNQVYNTYKCGHGFVETSNPTRIIPIFDSVDRSKHARDYQKDGVQFLLDCNLNGILADQMRQSTLPPCILSNLPIQYSGFVRIRYGVIPYPMEYG